MKGKKKFEMGEHSFLWGTLVVAIIFFAAAVMLYRAHPGVGGDAAFPVMAAFIMLLGAALSILEVRHWEPAHPERLSLAEKAVLAYRMLFPDKTLIMFLYVLLYALILGSLGFNIATFLSVVGSYTVNNSVTDIYWMLGFGVIGYFLKLYHVPIGPIILGTILRSLIELNYRRGIAIAFYSVPDYIMGFFTHPLSLGLLIFLVFMIFSQSAVYKKWADGRAEARELRKRSRKAAKSGK